MVFGKKGEDEVDISKVISRFKDLSKEDKIELISHFISELRKLHDVTEQEILGKKEACIPIHVFGNDSLSSLEAIVKYLKEKLRLKFSKIGKLLNRSSKTIWTTYHNAARKMPSSFDDVPSDVSIPVSTFADRSYSTLESVVGYIKDLDYSNHEIALMLHLDDRTIWTVYDRVKKKRGLKS